MRYAIAVLTHDNKLHVFHQVVDSPKEAILNALESLDIYHGESVENLQCYLYEINIEVDVIAIEDDTDGCVLAYYDASGKLGAEYYPNQTSYQAILSLLGDLAPVGLTKNFEYLIEFIEHLDMLLDCKEVKFYD